MLLIGWAPVTGTWHRGSRWQVPRPAWEGPGLGLPQREPAWGEGQVGGDKTQGLTGPPTHRPAPPSPPLP